MRIVSISFIGIALFFLESCQDLFSSFLEEKNYLTYKNQTLEKKEMDLVLRKAKNASDSLQKMENYKKVWLKRKLYAHKGEALLTSKEQEEIEHRVMVFKDNLLKFKYINNVLLEDLDTAITSQEWAEYQKRYLLKNKANRDLKSFRFKFVYMVVDEFVPDLEEMVETFSSFDQKIPKKVRDFAYYQARPFSFNQNRTYRYSQISKMFPESIREQILSQIFLPKKGKNKTIIDKQEGKQYLIRIYKIENTSSEEQKLSASELDLIKQEIISKREKEIKVLLDQEISQQTEAILNQE